MTSTKSLANDPRPSIKLKNQGKRAHSHKMHGLSNRDESDTSPYTSAEAEQATHKRPKRGRKRAKRGSVKAWLHPSPDDPIFNPCVFIGCAMHATRLFCHCGPLNAHDNSRVRESSRSVAATWPAWARRTKYRHSTTSHSMLSPSVLI